MVKFAANLTFLFKEYPPHERIEKAALAGFEHVEILNPYELPATDIQRALARHQVGLTLINCPPPNYTGGAAGFAAQPEQQDRFRRDFKRTMRYAQLLRPQHVHIMAGAAEGHAAHAVFVENLKWAAAEAPGQSLTIEPINRGDMPGYFLCDYEQARAILAEVAAPNLGLQFDVYHAFKITGDALQCWDEMRDLVTHIQIGGIPDRREPEAGKFDFPAFFVALDAQGYSGFVSAEYNPRKTTEAGLGWLARG